MKNHLFAYSVVSFSKSEAEKSNYDFFCNVCMNVMPCHPQQAKVHMKVTQ